MKKLHVLDTLVGETNKSIFNGLKMLVVQHLFPDTLELLLHLKSLGISHIWVIGKPYSSRQDVVSELRRNGISVFLPTFDELEEGSALEPLIKNVIEECKDRNEKFIILEDGGYIVPYLHKHFVNELRYCVGAVEQTTSGKWADEEIERAGLLRIPVATIASSYLKTGVEATHVADAVLRSIEKICYNLGKTLTGMRVGVIGYGTIGSNIAKKLRDRHAIVAVNDEDPIRMTVARSGDGFDTGNKNSIINRSELIIGCTGRRSVIDATNILHDLQNDAMIANASSRRFEIDFDSLKRLSGSIKKIESVGTEFKLIDDRRIFVLAHGFPVNFFFGESLPAMIADLTLCELFLCLRHIAKGNLKPKIYYIEKDFYQGEKDLARRWYDYWYRERKRN